MFGRQGRRKGSEKREGGERRRGATTGGCECRNYYVVDGLREKEGREEGNRVTLGYKSWKLWFPQELKAQIVTALSMVHIVTTNHFSAHIPCPISTSLILCIPTLHSAPHCSLRSILASASLACKLPLKPNFAFNSRTSIFAPALFLRATILLNILAVLAPRRPRQDQALRRQHRDAAAPGVVGAAQDQQPARNCHVRLE